MGQLLPKIQRPYKIIAPGETFLVSRASVPTYLFGDSINMLEKLLPKNEHIADRAIRVVAGITLLSLVFIGPQTMWGLVGLVPLVTGLVGSCPIYTMFGIGTCQIKGKS